MKYVNDGDKVKITRKGMNLLHEAGKTPPPAYEDLLNTWGEPLRGVVCDSDGHGAVIEFTPMPNGRGGMVAYVSIGLKQGEFNPEEGNFVIVP